MDANLADKASEVTMKVLRPDYYENNGSLVNTSGFNLSEQAFSSIYNYSSGSTLNIQKKNDSFGTFDDGLLF